MIKWFVVIDNQKFGPFSERFLYELYAQNKINQQTLVLSENVEDKNLIVEILNLSQDQIDKKINEVPDEKQRKIDIKNFSEFEEYLMLQSIGIAELPTEKEEGNIEFPDLPDFTQTKEITDFPGLKEELTNSQINVPIPPIDEGEDEEIEKPSIPNDERDDSDDSEAPPILIEDEVEDEKTPSLSETNLSDQEGTVTREVNLAQANLSEVDEEGIGELTQEVRLAEFDLKEEEQKSLDEEAIDQNIEIEIVEKPKKPMNKFIVFGGGGFLLLVAIFVIFMVLTDDELIPNSPMKNNQTIKTQESDTKTDDERFLDRKFEKDFISASMFEMYPAIKKIIQDKSRGMELLVDGEILRNKQCYQGNLYSLNSDLQLPSSLEFEITKVI